MTEFSGIVEIEDSTRTDTRITIDGDKSKIGMTDRDRHGTIIFDGDGNAINMLDKAIRSSILVDGNKGELFLYNPDTSPHPTVRLRGKSGSIAVGGQGTNGLLKIDNIKSQSALTFEATNGVITLFDGDGKRSIVLEGTSGNISVNQRTIFLILHVETFLTVLYQIA